MSDNELRSAHDGLTFADPRDLAVVRSFARTAALACGLSSQRTDLLVLAVSELATNALEHTTGGGRVRVWCDGPQVVCEVIDGGGARSFGNMPSVESYRGRGLAIVGRVVDEVAAYATATGTVVRLRMNS